MRIRSLTLRDFRNLAEARLDLQGHRHFFVGPNGQGKTNLLEAAGCLTALRSFRGADTAAMIRAGVTEAGIAAELDHEKRGPTRLRLLLRADGKEVWTDEERIRRLADYLGQFPVVAFSSQDLQLIRGAATPRRKWLDLTLAAMDAEYLQALQAYSKALAGRNRLLKQGAASQAQLSAFEAVMAPPAAVIGQRRQTAMTAIAAELRARYAAMADGEAAELTLAPGRAETAAAWQKIWADGRARDLKLRSTPDGPHREDLSFQVQGVSAREYASEGQQRSLVLSLRLAQVAYFHSRSGTRPVILADDVLGELDGDRRRRFWELLDPAAQVLATGTTLPNAALGDWQTLTVNAGTFSPAAPPG